jgi:ferredoxin
VDESGDLILLANAVAEDRLGDVEAAVAGCPTEALALEN